jgi:hypothetical protein
LDYHCNGKIHKKHGKIYGIDLHLLADLKIIRNEFISGFIRSISGEKDPRNLMIVYTIIQKIVALLDITNHVEVSVDINKTSVSG